MSSLIYTSQVEDQFSYYTVYDTERGFCYSLSFPNEPKWANDLLREAKDVQVSFKSINGSWGEYGTGLIFYSEEALDMWFNLAEKIDDEKTRKFMVQGYSSAKLVLFDIVKLWTERYGEKQVRRR